MDYDMGIHLHEFAGNFGPIGVQSNDYQLWPWRGGEPKGYDENGLQQIVPHKI